MLPFTLYSQFFLFVSLYGTSRKSMDLAILHFMTSNLLAIRMSCRKLCTSLSKYVMPLGVLFLCVVSLRHWDVVALRCCCVDSYIIYYTYICIYVYIYVLLYRNHIELVRYRKILNITLVKVVKI